MATVNGITSVDTGSVYTGTTSESNAGSTDFSSYLTETKSLDDIFKQASETYGVSEDLLKAVAKAESNFNPDAVSQCGAQGIMQLMPSTATSLGVTDAFDAEQNIMGGAQYISGLLQKYDGDTSLALAAYNAGSGNVAKYGGIPPFEETQNYVKKVLNYMNEGVDTGNTVVSVASSTDSAQAQPVVESSVSSDAIKSTAFADDNNIGDLFTYETYLKFLDEFFRQEEQNQTQDNPLLHASRSIQYNPAILNLLK